MNEFKDEAVAIILFCDFALPVSNTTSQTDINFGALGKRFKDKVVELEKYPGLKCQQTHIQLQ